jgi:glycosyltransferase involved in cell wall biosynthesis
MKFDIVITTYNRPERVVDFVKQIINCSLTPNAVIVVDSSDVANQQVADINLVNYIRSLHKNQPYQRYLGAMASDADVLCFFDDDLTITDNTLFEHLLNPYQKPNVVGTSVGIKYENPSDTSKYSLKTTDWLRKIFSVKIPPIGQISYAGIVGPKPTKMQAVEYFHGPCMSFKKEVFLDTLNSKLLCIFEKKNGYGRRQMHQYKGCKEWSLDFQPSIIFIPSCS